MFFGGTQCSKTDKVSLYVFNLADEVLQNSEMEKQVKYMQNELANLR